MRCPAGVGAWAAHYIQPRRPEVGDSLDDTTTFDHPYLDGLLTVLSTVLLPVKGREGALKELKVTSPVKVKDNIWVVLDSEGEEDEDPSHSWSLLRENDLVSILNQGSNAPLLTKTLKVLLG